MKKRLNGRKSGRASVKERKTFFVKRKTEKGKKTKRFNMKER